MRVPRATLLILLTAFLVRGLLILATLEHGGNDFRIYHHFGSRTLRGEDPYAPTGGPLDAYRDNPPLNLLTFAALLAAYDHPATLRLAFALTDLLVLGLLLHAPRVPDTRRRTLAAFYAFNPFVLHAWTLTAQDKPLILLLVLLTILLARAGRWRDALLAAALATAFKWTLLLFLPFLALHAARQTRTPVATLAPSALLLTLAQLPYAPQHLVSLHLKAQRAHLAEPQHVSPLHLLHWADAYAPGTYTLLTLLVLALLAIPALQGRLPWPAALAATLALTLGLAPETPHTRLLLILIPALLLRTTIPVRTLWTTTTLYAALLLPYHDPHWIPPALRPYAETAAHPLLILATTLLLAWTLRPFWTRPGPDSTLRAQTISTRPPTTPPPP